MNREYQARLTYVMQTSGRIACRATSASQAAVEACGRPLVIPNSGSSQGFPSAQTENTSCKASAATNVGTE